CCSGSVGSDTGSGVVVGAGVVVGRGVVGSVGVRGAAGAVVCGARSSTSDRSRVGRGVSTTHRCVPSGSFSTTTETVIAPACVGTTPRALCVPVGPATGVLTVGPVMATG